MGRIAGVTETGVLLVAWAEGAPVAAIATAQYDAASIGRAVALLFVDGDPARPIAIGLVADAPPVAAPEQVVLECGRASIVLTRAGKVLIRGTYVSSRSSGMQRITGAAVQIN